MSDQNFAAEEFVNQSRKYLVEDFFPRIEHTIQLLTDEQVWWRPNEESNSIGNLMLHLEGNIRQWIVASVGGKINVRERDKEFSHRTMISGAELLEKLRTAVTEVDEVLRDLSPSVLSERRSIQGFDVSVLEAIYHVVEHFSMHTGQIFYIAKLLTGTDLNFYSFDAQGTARKTW